MNVICPHVEPEDCEEIIEKTIKGGKGAMRRLLFEEDGKKYKARERLFPFYLEQRPRRLSPGNAVSPIARNIWEYIAKGRLFRL